MNIIVFDTETSGLTPGNICQLSYLIIDGNSILGKNFYFKVNYIEPKASEINGLTPNLLRTLSNNKSFGDHYYNINSDFSKAELLIAHNYSFDSKFLKSEFQSCGGTFKGSKSFCTMKYFTDICRLPSRNKSYGYKYPKLEELVSFLKINKKEIRKKANEVFGVDEKTLNEHDSRFDVVATYLCYLKGIEYGYIHDNSIRTTNIQKKLHDNEKSQVAIATELQENKINKEVIMKDKISVGHDNLGDSNTNTVAYAIVIMIIVASLFLIYMLVK